MPKIVFLATDIVLYALLVAVALYIWSITKNPNLRQTWRTVTRDSGAMAAAVILVSFLAIALLDSLHFRPLLPPAADAPAHAGPAYSTQTLSVLDHLLQDRRNAREKTYSEPLATHQYSKETMLVDGKSVRVNPRLVYGGAHLTDPHTQWAGDVTKRSITGLLYGAVSALAMWCLVAWARVRAQQVTLVQSLGQLVRGDTDFPWRAVLITASLLALLVGWLSTVWPYYHVAGTDQTGNDVLFQGVKSIRTAIVIGSLATLATLPFAVILGILAGYFKGWVDDVIQYVYTVLTAIPYVLLIAAFVLLIQLFLDKNPNLFETALERADIRLFLLATILGMTGWATLARLLRAETLKLSELDYVQAARAFGVSNFGIMKRHILPNIMHVVLIVAVLDFSGLVLIEAVLSYVGVGVDPITNSFGGMINSSRTELSRDPVVWWNLATAFTMLVALVLAMQMFAFAVQLAFDPRARAFKPKRSRAGTPAVAPVAATKE